MPSLVSPIGLASSWAAFVISLVLASALVGCSDDHVPTGVHRPINQGSREFPTWVTRVEIEVPAQWEQYDDVYACVLGDQDSYRIEGSDGDLIAPIDDSLSNLLMLPGISVEPVGDTCSMSVAVTGEFTQLSDTYTFTNGRFAATFDDAEFFSGGGDREDPVARLRPVKED